MAQAAGCRVSACLVSVSTAEASLVCFRDRNARVDCSASATQIGLDSRPPASEQRPLGRMTRDEA